MKLRNGRVGLMVAVALAVVLVSAACGGVSKSPSNSGGSDILRVGAGASPETYDPALVTAGATVIFLRPVYDTLIALNAKSEIVPGVAKSVDVQPGELKIELRDDVKFTDGTKLDATAVKQNLERAATKPGQWASVLKAISSVDIAGPTSLTIHFNRDSASLITALSDTAGMLVSPKALNNPDLPQHPVGSGPWIYQSSQSVPGDHRTYTANPNYWDKAKQGVKKLIIYDLTDPSAASNAVAAGQVDLIVGSTSQAKQAKSQGLKVVSAPNKFLTILLLDPEGNVTPALGDVRVRRAISLAIDRKAFAKYALYNYGEPTAQWFPSSSPYHYPQIDSALDFNLKKARSLMAQAGYADGFSMDVVVSTNYQAYAEAMSVQLAKINIKVSLASIPTAEIVSAAQSKKYSMFITPSGVATAATPQLVYDSYYAPTGRFNPFGFEDSRLSALDAAALAASGDKQAAAYARLEKYLLVDKVYGFVIGTMDTIAIARSNVADVHITHDPVPDLYGVHLS